MKVEEIMKEIMAKKGMSKAQLGRAVGISKEKNPSDVINKRLKQKNISVNILAEMLSVMGYTIVVAPNGSELIDGEFEVTTDG